MIAQLISREVTIGCQAFQWQNLRSFHEAHTVQIHVNWSTGEAFTQVTLGLGWDRSVAFG